MTERRTILLALFGAAVVVYLNSLWNGFAYDDVWIIARNDRVHQLSDLRSIWLTPYWPSFGSELGLYRPFTIFAFAVQWAIGNGAPWVFHLTSVLLHAVVTLLVFLLADRLFSRRVALAAAFVFAIHPLHTEAVANVVGQGELWAALGVLSACVIYAGRPEGVGLDWRRRTAILAIYALALLAKESAVVLPGLLVLLDVVQRRIAFDRKALAHYARAVAFMLAMFCVVLGAFLTLRLAVLGNLTGTDAAPGLPYLREQYRLLNAFRAWPEFVRLLFVPFNLSVDYSPGLILPVESFTPMVVLGMLLVLITLVLFVATPWRPRAGFVAGWFFLTILPVSNFLFPIGVLIAERTLYLPSLAACLIAGYGWEAARASSKRETRRLAVALAVIIAISFGFKTVRRNPDWDSLLAVWKGLARDHPESYRSQWLKAIDLWAANQPRLAEQYFLLADRIWSRDSQLHKEFGNFYIGQRNYAKAIEYLERSRNATPFVPQTWELLGYAYLYAGRPADALAAARHASGMEGTHPALTNAVIGGAYYELGRYDESAGAWRVATRSLNGDLWLNWANLARALAAAGRTQQALAAADTAFARTGREPSLQNVVAKLRTAIRANCFPDGVGCDPLEGWAVTVASAAAERGK